MFKKVWENSRWFKKVQGSLRKLKKVIHSSKGFKSVQESSRNSRSSQKVQAVIRSIKNYERSYYCENLKKGIIVWWVGSKLDKNEMTDFSSDWKVMPFL